MRVGRLRQIQFMRPRQTERALRGNIGIPPTRGMAFALPQTNALPPENCRGGHLPLDATLDVKVCSLHMN